ncbi:LysR family transcriptional regulator [Streptomyces sp. LP11]|uniref:LysR family transcriptional regulator n=1 Tax=Streptomyces pyxinicus TaxID=2970331 RepID=A0ABT2B5J5_9ACTN|nr:LysR family transcriptional regulator [Streptomyces sp. LP11]MCS0603631.1 LysR family transcriptional regulator [Streptomyces sp. LP11]
MDEGSATRAPGLLRMTPPAVTNGIQALERSLGPVLVERLPGGAGPTRLDSTIVVQRMAESGTGADLLPKSPWPRAPPTAGSPGREQESRRARLHAGPVTVRRGRTGRSRDPVEDRLRRVERELNRIRTPSLASGRRSVSPCWLTGPCRTAHSGARTHQPNDQMTGKELPGTSATTGLRSPRSPLRPGALTLRKLTVKNCAP